MARSRRRNVKNLTPGMLRKMIGEILPEEPSSVFFRTLITKSNTSCQAYIAFGLRLRLTSL